MANCTFCNRPTRPGHTCPQEQHREHEAMTYGIAAILLIVFLFYMFVFTYKAYYKERVNAPVPQILTR